MFTELVEDIGIWPLVIFCTVGLTLSFVVTYLQNEVMKPRPSPTPPPPLLPSVQRRDQK